MKIIHQKLIILPEEILRVTDQNTSHKITTINIYIQVGIHYAFSFIFTHWKYMLQNDKQCTLNNKENYFTKKKTLPNGTDGFKVVIMLGRTQSMSLKAEAKHRYKLATYKVNIK